MKGSQTALLLALAGAGALGIRRASRWARAIEFADRSILIFGGSRGLGLVLARELGAQGARLTLAARDEAELERALWDLADRGVPTATVTCDVRDPDDVERAVERAAERQGGIDVLINDAGIIQVGPFEHMSPEDFDNAMRTHFWGPLHAIYAALPYLRRSTARRIVNISSIGGRIAVPHLLPYCASKFALAGFSDGLHAELARERIYVTTVIPGLMRTGSTYNAQFKGRHRQEFAWFHTSDALPGLSIDARRAAHQIIEACRYGDAQRVITAAARLAIVMNAFAPETTAWLMTAANRVLPAPGRADGDLPQSGWESTSAVAPSPLTVLADRATEANNEVPSFTTAAARP